jgi:hypothetical protein
MAAKRLHLGASLALPLDFATEGVAVIGMRGSGKSNTEAVFVEQLYKAGIPFAVVDPKGDWHGIKSSADGKKPGLSVAIFGGLHGDFPLEAHLGARIADLLVDENLSAVLDVSHLSKTGQLPEFLIAFCNQLMHRHQLEPHVRTVVFEEAHRYIPQNVSAKVNRLVPVLKEAAASLLLEGRAWGLGCLAATQRPARLHKDVLEEVANAIIHRIGVAATNDKKTIAGWTSHYELSASIVESLTELNDGEAWVLMPQARFVAKVQMDRRTTFDSAATPKVGATIRRPTTMAEIDSDAIKAALGDVIERAEADDPKALRAEIARLKRELESARSAAPETVVERIDVPVLDEGLVVRVEAALEPFAALLSEVQDRLTWEVKQRDEIVEFERRLAADRRDTAGAGPTGRRAEPGELVGAGRGRPARVAARQAEAQRPAERADPPARRDARRAAGPGAPPPEGVKLGKGDRNVLVVLAQWPEGVDHNRLAFLAGYSASSSTISVILSRLRRLGLVEPAGTARLTAEGRAHVGPVEPLPTGADLLNYWMHRKGMGGGDRQVLQILADEYPRELSHEEICDLAGYSPDSSTMSVILSRLRRLGLVEQRMRRLDRQFAEAIR